MSCSLCYFGLTLIVVFLMVQESRAKVLPRAGLLDQMPKNCTGVDFCQEKHEDYPQEQIDALLGEKYQLGLVRANEDPIIRDGTSEDSSDCEKSVTYDLIYEIIDEAENVRVVVQSPKHFKQQIRIEQCSNPGRLQNEIGTRHFTAEELQVYNISCVEKKMDYSFLVLSLDGQTLESVRSKNGIPVCCSCRIYDD